MRWKDHGWQRWGAVLVALVIATACPSPGAAQGRDPSFLAGLPEDVGLAPPQSPAVAEPPRVSNIFVETFITQALQDIAMQAGVNVLTDPGVQGFVTLELNEVPFEQALQMILAPGGFTYVKLDETTYLVGKADRSSPIFSQLTQTRLVRLNHATADQARRLVSEYYTNYVRFDPETNTALITAPPDLLERIEADLAQVDQPLPQVAIEAIVTEVSEEGRKELGLDWQLKNEPGGCGMARPWPWAVWSRRARNR